MKYCLILTLFLVQASLAQSILQLHYNVDLNRPTHSSLFATPDYATWKTPFSFGGSIDVPIFDDLSLRYSIDYSKRVFDKYTHPLKGAFGYDSYKPAFGGDGSIFRFSAGPSFRGRITEAVGYSLHAGVMLTKQSYGDVYYYYSGFISGDPLADPYQIIKVNNPSSIFFGFAGSGTFSYSVSDNIGLLVGFRTIQNEQTGFYWQSLVGVSFGL